MKKTESVLKAELGGRCAAFAPEGLPQNYKVPFLSMSTPQEGGSEIPRVVAQCQNRVTCETLSVVQSDLPQLDDSAKRVHRSILSCLNPFKSLLHATFETDFDAICNFTEEFLQDDEFVLCWIVSNLYLSRRSEGGDGDTYIVRLFGLQCFLVSLVMAELFPRNMHLFSVEQDQQLVDMTGTFFKPKNLQPTYEVVDSLEHFVAKEKSAM